MRDKDLDQAYADAADQDDKASQAWIRSRAVTFNGDVPVCAGGLEWCSGCKGCCHEDCKGCAYCGLSDDPAQNGWVGSDGRP